MSTAVVCPACDEVVFPDAVRLSDLHIGYTWLGDRAKWTSDHFGLVHLCDPLRRELVYARDGLPVANPPWLRWIWRYRATRALAARLPDREFTPRLTLIHARETP